MKEKQKPRLNIPIYIYNRSPSPNQKNVPSLEPNGIFGLPYSSICLTIAGYTFFKTSDWTKDGITTTDDPSSIVPPPSPVADVLVSEEVERETTVTVLDDP